MSNTSLDQTVQGILVCSVNIGTIITFTNGSIGKVIERFKYSPEDFYPILTRVLILEGKYSGCRINYNNNSIIDGIINDYALEVS